MAAKPDVAFLPPTVPNRVVRLDEDILSHISRLFFADELAQKLDTIATEIVPDASKSWSGNVEHDRQVINMKILASLGLRGEDWKDGKPMREYAEEALARKKEDIKRPVISFVAGACNHCASTAMVVTDQCENCVGRPCADSCGKKAISHTTGHALIDQTKCVKCGMCEKACPFHAIVKKPTPCMEACPVGAISQAADGSKIIDHDKCISCGACIRACPFGAVMYRSELLDVIRGIKDPNRKIVAMLAPAVAGHFSCTMPSIRKACVDAGFDACFEVAMGADVTTMTEAAEFDERMEEFKEKKPGMHPFMMTSCCPAWVNCARKHLPEIETAVSSTYSPMIYSAQIAKKQYPGCECVFVGPCVGKLSEGIDHEIVDYVMTFRDLSALIRSKDLKYTPNMPSSNPAEEGCADSRGFPVIGGVATAVAQLRVADPEHFPGTLEPVVVDGLSKASVTYMRTFAKKCPGNIVEVMACPGGCVNGPGGVLPATMAKARVAMTVKQSKLFAGDEHNKPSVPVTLTPVVIRDGKIVA